MNKCHFVGKLADDPVLYPKDRTVLVRFTLAVEEYRKDKSGQKIRRVEFLDFEAWDTAAQTIYDHTLKGDCMAIEAIARKQKSKNENSYVNFRVTNFKIFNSNNYENVDEHE
tara:strand:- start:461 stop:796 length:336 start_codon:yes stop_codon:yes gene_type:complete